MTGCETTQEKSAQLEKVAHHTRLAERGLSIDKQSADVRVLGAVLVHGAEGAAAVVTLRNDSAHALKDVPIAITVKDARGKHRLPEQRPGTGSGAHLARVAAGARRRDVGRRPGAGNRRPGERERDRGRSPGRERAAPARSKSPACIQAKKAAAQPRRAPCATARTSPSSRSSSTSLARRAGRIVAAGRAILPEVAPGAAVPFQAFLVGSRSERTARSERSGEHVRLIRRARCALDEISS